MSPDRVPWTELFVSFWAEISRRVEEALATRKRRSGQKSLPCTLCAGGVPGRNTQNTAGSLA